MTLPATVTRSRPTRALGSNPLPGTWILLPLALFGLVACEMPAGPDVDPPTVQIDVAMDLASNREPSILVTGEAGEIVVEGLVTVGHTNHALHPALHRLRRGHYRLTLEAKSAGLGLTIVTTCRYRAVLQPWPAGVYHLEVVMRLPDGSQYRAFDDQVAVN